MVFFIGKSFVDGLSLTKPAMYVTLLGLGFNVFANWLLIYGNWGFPRLELDGAGIGTLCARTFMAILMTIYIFRASRFKEFRLPWAGADWDIIKKILRLGIPSGLQWFFEVGAFVAATVMIGWIGQEERAAHQIAMSLASVTFMFVTGFAAGASIRVGNALGRNDWNNVRKAGNSGLILAMGFMVISAIVFVIGKEWLPSLFLKVDPAAPLVTNNAEVLRLAAYLMLVAAFFQIFDGAQAVGAGILRGIQDVKIPTLITLIAYWVIAIPGCYILGFTFDLGLNGVWYAFVGGLGVSAILLTSRFWYLTKKREAGGEILD
jgi:MATE family multidrug resistance protein